MTVTPQRPSVPRTWSDAEKALSVAWPGFSAREPQRTMALAVSQVAHNSGPAPVLLAQAGTGVGKSLGYLIPAIQSGKRVVVAVSTKSLQEQLYTRDLPNLKATLFPDLTFAMLKGRSNYVCMRNSGDGGASVRPGSDGERGDLLRPVDDKTWSEMITDAEGCVGRQRCKFGNECFAERAKDRALAARVLVVNTSLLTQDLRLRLMTGGERALLGDYQLLVVDEAHEMPGIVADGLSTQITLGRIVAVAQRLRAHLLAKDADAWLDQMLDAASQYFEATARWFRIEAGKDRTAKLAADDRIAIRKIVEPLGRIQDETTIAACTCESAELDEPWCEHARRVDTLAADLSVFTLDSDVKDVVWIEYDERKGRITLRTAPVEVGGFLDAALWHQDGSQDPVPTVMASATLSMGSDFSYIAQRTGLGRDTYRGMDVGSPFDYGRQARLYLPYSDDPDPKQPVWRAWAQQRMTELVGAAGGGALLLFTSVSAMREAYENVAPRLESQGMRTFCQYQPGSTNRELAEAFASDTHSVLFGTRSFMTGVDFPGDTCRLVIIDKMPFPTPGDPVFEARCRLVDQRLGDGSSFRHVAIPEMTMVLLQAFGRLIRTTSDRGVVAILDGRLRKGWTSQVRRALPPAPVIGSVDAVADFLKARGAR
ncbi:MAG: ATP-dependent DNA helicase [Candidatus Saccharibacteria bacterium]